MSRSLTLPDSISSVQDLSSVAVEIHSCLKWLTHETVKKRAGTSQSTSLPSLSPAAKTLVHEWGSNQEELEALIAALDDLQKNAQTITITLAAQPSGSIKEQLVGWCRRELSQNILVNFTFNRSLLGGVVIRAGSRVFDWSFRRKIIAAGDKFPEVLGRV